MASASELEVNPVRKGIGLVDGSIEPHILRPRKEPLDAVRRTRTGNRKCVRVEI